MIAAVLPHAHRQVQQFEALGRSEQLTSRHFCLSPRRYSVSWSSRFVAKRLRGVEKDTKLLELSAEGTILLELFASNFVPDGRGSR
jgi:hypothetical protein